MRGQTLAALFVLSIVTAGAESATSSTTWKQGNASTGNQEHEDVTSSPVSFSEPPEFETTYTFDTMASKKLLDVVIVGGGTSGLSAALIFGRARRNVVVLDDGAPRNAPAHAVGGMFGHDGTPPLELLKIAKSQLSRYDTIEIRPQRASGIAGADGEFIVTLADGSSIMSRKVMLATGVSDELPDIPGFKDAWGDKIFHCPFCHGFEVRNQPLAVLGNDDKTITAVTMLRLWSQDLRVLTNGPVKIGAEDLGKLKGLGVLVDSRPIESAVIESGSFWGLKFEDGSKAPLGGIMIGPGQHERSGLAEKLGLAKTASGHVQVDNLGQTSVPGLYAVGDITSFAQSVILAAGRAAEAAYMLTHKMAFEFAGEALEETK